MAAHTGLFFAALGAEPADGTLSQSLATTPGANYTVDWWLKSDGMVPNHFKVTFGGTILADLTNSSAFNWTHFSFNATAPTSTTLFQISESNVGGLLSLDDVGVNIAAAAVPAPAAIWSGLVLLAAVAGIARARARAHSSQSR